MNINAKGVFLMTKAAVPHMKRQGWGRVISMSSVAGLVPLPERAAYSASKAAVIGLTRSVAHDLAPLGITVNCICPGSITTDRAISSTLRAGWSDVAAGLAERAIDTLPRTCGMRWNSSAMSGNSEPPVPVPVGSQVCAMKPSITR